MRRWIALLAALALIPMGGAIAETKWKVKAAEEIAPEEEDADGSAAATEGELAVVDPVTGKIGYPFWMDETDGSEMLFFMLIDSVNDEAALVEENGSLTIRMDFLDIYGEVYSTSYRTLFDTEFGKAILMYDGGDDMRWYSFAERTAVLRGGGVTVGGPSFPHGEFEDAWANSCYPVAYEEVLHAMAPAEDGFTYMRTSGTCVEEGPCELEYKLGDDMRLQWVKLFEMDESGEPVLSVVITYSTGDPVDLPDSVVQKLREA